MYSYLVSKNLKIKIYEISFCQLFWMDVKPHLSQITSTIYMYLSEGAKEDIWT